MEVDPIDVGATIEVGSTNGRITNIWIDEDGTPHLSIRWTGIRYGDRPDEKVAYSDLRAMLEENEAERTNTGHEAWEWRAENVDA
jgi:hypothetical protein